MEKGGSKSWELSLYELQRRPQEAVTDDTEVTINPRALHSELMCPICLDIMTNTMTTKECLHRFCSECIITALRNGNKECPTCRKKLVSKRSLRHDPNFDALITKICPSRATQIIMPPPPDKDEESSQMPSEPHTPGANGQAEEAASPGTGRTAKRSKSSTPNEASSGSAITAPSSRRVKKETLHQQDQEQIDIILKWYPEDATKAVESISKYLKTPPEAFIEHLMVYLHLRHQPAPPDASHVAVYARNKSEEYVLLDKSLTIENVNSQHGLGVNKPLELYYKIVSPKIEHSSPDHLVDTSDSSVRVKDEV